MGKKLRNFIIKIDNKMKIMAIKYKYILIMVINRFLQGSKYDYWLLLCKFISSKGDKSPVFPASTSEPNLFSPSVPRFRVQ